MIACSSGHQPSKCAILKSSLIYSCGYGSALIPVCLTNQLRLKSSVSVPICTGSTLDKSTLGLVVDTHITASGNISSSITSTGSFGRVEATKFVGDGSGITGLASAAISTYNSSGNDRIITSVNSSTVQGESNLTFNSNNQLTVNGDITSSGNISGSLTSTLEIGGHASVGAVTASSYTGSFVGDGSGLTGVSQNIDTLSNYGAQTLHQSQDHFLVSDNGTEKKINFSDLEDSIFANVSGEVTIAAGGAATIAANTIGNNELKQDDDITLQSLTTTNNISGSTIEGQTLTADVFLSSPSASLTNITTTNITSSGNISSSGTISAADINIGGGTGATGVTIESDGNTTIDGNTSIGGFLDLVGTTDATNASGDTGILRVEGGASIAKKLFVGTNLHAAAITASGNISSSGNISASKFVGEKLQLIHPVSGSVLHVGRDVSGKIVNTFAGNNVRNVFGGSSTNTGTENVANNFYGSSAYTHFFATFDADGEEVMKGGGSVAGGNLLFEFGDVGGADNNVIFKTDVGNARFDFEEGYVDIHNTSDATNATGDTGALRVEGGVSIAKKVFAGTFVSSSQLKSSNDIVASTHITASGNISGSTIEGQTLTADVFLSSPSASLTNITTTNITASGNITGSTIEAQTFVTDVFLSSPSASITNLTNTNITSSGHISASGNIITKEIEAHSNFTIDAGGDIELNADGAQITMKDGAAASRFTFNLDTTPELDVNGAFTIDCSSDMSIDVHGGNLVLANNGTTRFDFGVDDTPEISTVGDLIIDPSGGNTLFDSHITASGNISSSGTIFANKLEVTEITSSFVTSSTSILIQNITSSGDSLFGNDSTDIHTFTGDITASGDLIKDKFVQMTNSQSVVDTFTTSSFRSSKYILQVTSASNHQLSELLVLHHSGVASNTEYGQINSGLNLVNFSTDISVGGDVRLIASSSFVSCSVRYDRTLIRN